VIRTILRAGATNKTPCRWVMDRNPVRHWHKGHVVLLGQREPLAILAVRQVSPRSFAVAPDRELDIGPRRRRANPLGEVMSILHGMAIYGRMTAGGS
jgi:hypothetical protein